MNRKEYLLKNKDKIKISKKKHYMLNRDDILKKKKEDRLKNINEFRKKDMDYYYKNRDKMILKNKKLSLSRKIRVYNHYSNYDIKCNCCGERMIEFLSIDHINNDGYKTRDSHSKNIVLWIIRNNFPSGFQILCHNCNFAKGKDKDHICPHKKQLVIDYFREI